MVPGVDFLGVGETVGLVDIDLYEQGFGRNCGLILQENDHKNRLVFCLI